MRDLGQNLGSMAERDGDSGLAGQVVRKAADAAQQAAGWLDEREPGEVLDEVRTYARHHPATFLAGAAVAGLLVGRLTRGLTAPASGQRSGWAAASGAPSPDAGRTGGRRPAAVRGDGTGAERLARRSTGAGPARRGGTVSAPEKERTQASVGELIGDVTRDMSTLVRKEVELAKAELREEASQAGKAGGMFGGAALAGFLAVLFVSYAPLVGAVQHDGPGVGGPDRRGALGRRSRWPLHQRPDPVEARAYGSAPDEADCPGAAGRLAGPVNESGGNRSCPVIRIGSGGRSRPPATS